MLYSMISVFVFIIGLRSFEVLCSLGLTILIGTPTSIDAHNIVNREVEGGKYEDSESDPRIRPQVR